MIQADDAGSVLLLYHDEGSLGLPVVIHMHPVLIEEIGHQIVLPLAVYVLL
jgi:hypothetical protein